MTVNWDPQETLAEPRLLSELSNELALSSDVISMSLGNSMPEIITNSEFVDNYTKTLLGVLFPKPSILWT